MNSECKTTPLTDSASAVAAELKTFGQSLARAAGRLAAATSIEAAAGAMRDSREILRGLSPIVQRLEGVATDIQSRADTAFAELEADLRDALGARGWRCDGQWPAFIIERALDVKIDEATRAASVAGRKLPVTSAASITETLIPLVESLLPPRFDPAQFLEQLGAAYDAARGSSATVPIFDLYRAHVMAQQKPKFWRNANRAAFQGLSTDQFRARLSALLEATRMITRDARVLRLLPPLDPKDALFVYQPAEKRFAFVGRVEFVREG